MYALCVSGAVNTQRFVWEFFYALCMHFYSFIYSHERKNLECSVMKKRNKKQQQPDMENGSVIVSIIHVKPASAMLTGKRQLLCRGQKAITNNNEHL